MSELNLMAPAADDTAARWQAVMQRDRTADGGFVFAVKTTGVYCRPSCGARRPNRENVVFFDTSAAALRRGYRPCLRCRPNEVAKDIALVDKVCRLIDTDPDRRASLDDLSREIGVSKFHLQRTFKRQTGLSPREYAAQSRADRFKQGVKAGAPVTAAAIEAGYGSVSRVYDGSASQMGMTPKQYKNGGAGIAVQYAICDCPFGRLLVASTEKGLCAVWFGDSDEEMRHRLRTEFPSADITQDAGALAGYTNAIVANMCSGRQLLDLPLDIQATAFQWQVWRVLQRIPRGETRSYSEVANQIGKPKSFRAVAQACASNRVALIIPCHRVVRGDGSLSGYRWGVERKRRLLEAEREKSEVT